MSSEIKTTSALVRQIRELILAARKTAAQTVARIQVVTCFEVGRRIVAHEQQGTDRAEYGKNLLRDLAIRLASEFGPGFSKSNLEYMRRFYLMYQDRYPAIAQTVSGQSEHDTKSKTLSRKLPAPQKKQSSLVNVTLSWSQYVFLMGIKNPEERSFYEIEAATQGWAVRELKRQFDSGLYERLALSRNKEGIRKLARKGHIVAHNHPSGGLEPSPSDITITAQLKAAGAIVGIELLDHIIFNRTGYFSFLESGRL